MSEDVPQSSVQYEHGNTKLTQPRLQWLSYKINLVPSAFPFFPFPLLSYPMNPYALRACAVGLLAMCLQTWSKILLSSLRSLYNFLVHYKLQITGTLHLHVKNGWGSTNFLREKHWGRGCTNIRKFKESRSFTASPFFRLIGSSFFK